MQGEFGIFDHAKKTFTLNEEGYALLDAHPLVRKDIRGFVFGKCGFPSLMFAVHHDGLNIEYMLREEGETYTSNGDVL